MAEDIVSRILLENYENFLNFVNRRIGDRSSAEDILQQSFLKALKDPPEKLQTESIRAWFYTILKNSIVDHYRSKSKDLKRFNETEIGDLVSTEELATAVCQCLHSLLPTINIGYAELLDRIDLNQEEPAAVAKELNISRNTLDVRLFRARKALKKSLEGLCGACTKHGCLDCSCKQSKAPIPNIRPPQRK